MASDPSHATLFPVAPSYTTLPSSGSAKMAHIFLPAPSGPTDKGITPVLVVLTTGLDTPMAANHIWIKSLKDMSLPGVSLLAYDRFGVGLTTDQSPKNIAAADGSNAGHSLSDSEVDLEELLGHVLREHFGTDVNLSHLTDSQLDSIPRIVFVAGSIGVQLVMLFAQRKPGLVSGLVFLDPAPQTGASFKTIAPDFDAPDFDEKDLPEGVTVDGLKIGRKLFDNEPSNDEGLHFKDFTELFPNGGLDTKLIGRDKNETTSGPFLTVLRNEPSTFAAQIEKQFNLSPVVHMTYLAPFWTEFCQKITRITDPDKAKGPIQVKGSGHLISMDQPDVVVTEVKEVIEKVQASAKED